MKLNWNIHFVRFLSFCRMKFSCQRVHQFEFDLLIRGKRNILNHYCSLLGSLLWSVYKSCKIIVSFHIFQTFEKMFLFSISSMLLLFLLVLLLLSHKNISIRFDFLTSFTWISTQPFFYCKSTPQKARLFWKLFYFIKLTSFLDRFAIKGVDNGQPVVRLRRRDVRDGVTLPLSMMTTKTISWKQRWRSRSRSWPRTRARCWPEEVSPSRFERPETLQNWLDRFPTLFAAVTLLINLKLLLKSLN